MNYWRNTKYEYELVLAIYVVAIVAYVAFSRRRQAKAQEDRFAGLAKGAEVETIGGLIAIVDEIDKMKITVLFWMQKVSS